MQAATALLAGAAVSAAAVSACASPNASVHAATCPATVRAEQRLATPAPPGWQSSSDGDTSHALSGITFFAGPPAHRASLVGDERPVGKGRMVATWPLSASETYWVACSYARTSVVLQRQLPAGLESCSVTYATQVRVGGLPEILQIECR